MDTNATYIKVESLRDYLYFKRVSISRAASELKVTRQYLGSIVNGAPAGRKLALKIEDWSGGAVRADQLIRGSNGGKA